MAVVGTVFADLLEVRTHGLARLFGIVTLDGFEDSFVMILAALGSAGNPKDPQSLLAEKTNNRIEQRKNQRIGRTFGERQMKIKISFDIGFRILTRAIHH